MFCSKLLVEEFYENGEHNDDENSVDLRLGTGYHCLFRLAQHREKFFRVLSYDSIVTHDRKSSLMVTHNSWNEMLGSGPALGDIISLPEPSGTV